MGSGRSEPTKSSRRARRARSMSRQTRATTVVSQPRMFSTSLVSERLRRNHDSCTASSASLSEPSIRYATASKWARCSSNSPACQSPSLTVTSSSRDPSLGRRSKTDRCDKETEMIEVEKLRKVYPGAVEAVAGIDFEVAPGEVFALLGPNGAGKSTTIGMLTTTVRPTGGSARLAGFDVQKQQLAAR